MERFWEKVDIAGYGKCWEWKANRHIRGYGIFWHNGKNVRANRMALVLSGSAPPSKNSMALHSCDNPPCCNPAHLRWGDAKENTADFFTRQGGYRGELSGNAIITSDIASQILKRRMIGDNIPTIAAALGLAESIVELVYVGRSWKHLHGADGNPTLSELRAARSKIKRTPANRIVTDEMVDAIYAARMRGESLSMVSKRMGLAVGTVSPIFAGIAFAYRLGLNGNPTLTELTAQRAANPNHKLSEDDISKIRDMLSNGFNGADVAKRYGVSRALVSNIKRGKR